MKVIKDFMAGNLEVRREILSSEDLRQLYSLVFRKMFNAGIWKAGLGHLIMNVSTGVTCEPLREWSKNQKYIPLITSIVMDAACPLENPKHSLRTFQSFFVFTTEGIDEKNGLLNDDYRPDKRSILRQFLTILREAYHQAEFYGAHVTPTIAFMKHTGGSEFWESKPIPADMIFEEYVRNKDKKPSEDMKGLFKLLIGVIMKSAGDVKMCSQRK